MAIKTVNVYVQGNPLEQLSDVRKLSHVAHEWLSHRKTKSFYSAITAETLRRGVQSLLQAGFITFRYYYGAFVVAFLHTFPLGFSLTWNNSRKVYKVEQKREDGLCKMSDIDSCAWNVIVRLYWVYRNLINFQ